MKKAKKIVWIGLFVVVMTIFVIRLIYINLFGLALPISMVTAFVGIDSLLSVLNNNNED